MNKRQHQLIMSILEQLDDRERTIIVNRFGLAEGVEPQTLEQVGKGLGVTKERIRQLEARALKKTTTDHSRRKTGNSRFMI